MFKIRAAVIGCGNVGKYAVKAIQQADDFDLAGIVELPEKIEKIKKKFFNAKVVKDIDFLQNVDVAILCIPSLSVEEVAKKILKKGINTVDAFDLHGDKMIDLKNKLSTISKKGGSVSITAAGWDPGVDSVIRALFKSMAPVGLTNTNFGPGMSMGHTVEVKKIEGVKNALSLTIPDGFNKHKRVVYVETNGNKDFEKVVEKIKNNQYFKDDDTTIKKVKDINKLIDHGHKVLIERKGASSGTHNQEMTYRASITNPAVTSQVMISAARASTKQSSGNYLLLEIPLIDFLPDNNRVEIIKDLV